MNKFPLFVFLYLIFSTNIFSQTPAPMPSSDESEIVKISTNLIQIDATVTDKKGKIVTDLTADDFEIYENKEKQTIANFSFVELQSDKAVASVALNPVKNPLPVPSVPNKLNPQQVRRTIALVVDDLGLSFGSLAVVRQALKRFVDEQMLPNDLVAIVRTASGIGVLQQFTTDKRQLYSAIERMRWYPLGAAGIGAVAQPAQINQSQQEYFTVSTLGAMGSVINGMYQLPGRKTIVLFSDCLAIVTRDDNGLIDDSGQIKDALRRTIELANRASVIINTIDSRGLVATGQSKQPGRTSLAEASSLLQAMQNTGDPIFETQEGLIALAEETGGRTFINNNDIKGSIQKMLDDQKGYYLLGYQPDDSTFDPQTRRFNKLEIRLKRSNLKVRYRSGFFGLTDEEFKRSPNQSAEEKLMTSLVSPFTANEINLRVNALFGGDARQGAFIRSLVHVEAKDLKFTDEADGTKKAVFNIVASTFGDNGIPGDTISKTYTLAVKPDLHRQMLEKGFVYQITLPVKKPGAYQLRVAVRDEQAEKIGTASQFVEVPNLKKDNLVLSGITLQSITPEQLKKVVNGETSPADQNKTEELDPQTDTALRRFRRNTVLQYAYTIYNAELDKAKSPQLQVRTRVFRDGKIFFEGSPALLDAVGQRDMESLKFNGAIALPANMDAGEYVLQIVVTDKLAEDKKQTAAQWIDFEIIQ